MAKYKKVGFAISAKEKQATVSLRKISARFTKMLRPVDKLNRKLRQTERALKPILNRLDRVGKKLTKFGIKASLGLTLPIIAAGTAVVRAATNFQSGMLKVKSLTQANYLQFQKLEGLARKLGKSTRYSAREAADAMGYLGMAGFKTNQIMKSLPGVLNLAAASGIELAESADFASNILTGFGKDASEMGEIGDKLTYAFTNSNTSLTELHNGLVKVGGMSKKAGLTFEDMTAAMMTMADAGYKAENAGVALSSSILRLSKFSMDGLKTGRANMVTRTLADLGIDIEEFLNTTGKKRATMKIPFIEFIQLLDAKGASTDDFGRIFGGDHTKAILGLSGEYGKMQKYMHGLTYEYKGLAKAHADMRNSGAEGGFKLLTSAAGDLAIALGSTGLLNTVDAVSRSLAYLVGDLAETDKGIMRVISAVLLLTVVLGPVAAGIGGLVKLIRWAWPLVYAFFTKGVGAGVTLLGGKVLAIGGLILSVVWGIWWLANNWERATKWMSESWDTVKTSIQETVNTLAWLLQTFVRSDLSPVEKFFHVLDGFGFDGYEKLNQFLELLKNSWAGKVLEYLGIKVEGNLKSSGGMPDEFKVTPANKLRIANFETTDNLIESLRPDRPAPLLPLRYSGFETKLPKVKMFPDFLAQGFGDVFGEDEAQEQKVMPAPNVLETIYREKENSKKYDFNRIKNPGREKQEKQEIDINVNLSGSAPEDVRVTTRRRGRAKVTVDTGRVMMGAI